MRSVKRSVTIAGHRTSLSVEEPFWQALREIAAERGLALAALVREIDTARAADPDRPSLSSAIRVFVLERYRDTQRSGSVGAAETSSRG